jgi:hypothetical protein
MSSLTTQWTSKQISISPQISANGSATDETDKIKEVVSFYSEQWSKKRSVTSLDWSPKVRYFESCLTAVP